jgi:HAE1 family hydrophobic/amphiphilic exporter-1
VISKFFIERPVLANVIALVTLLIGVVAIFGLPVSQYPNVVPPTIAVTARYPGASAQSVIDTVALPIEQQVNGVPGMLYMQSTSGSDGTYSLIVTFDIGTDLNFAQVLVQNRVSAALASLPQAVQAQGVNVQQKSTSILEIVTLSSGDPRYDGLYLSNFATLNLVNELARVPGVGNVNVFGAGQYAMRVWLDPERLRALNLEPQDVVQAIQSQSQEATAGQLGAPPAPPDQAFQFTVNVAGRLSDPAQFGDIVVKTGNDTGTLVTRVRDIGRVEIGAQTYGQIFTLDGKPAAGIAIYQSPNANALEVEKAVSAKMAALAKNFPQGVTYAAPFDTTKFVSTSIDEVYKTLIEAAVLVLVVIVFFLQDWRATLVPATTVPVTIIGAFAAMAALGFSVNLSTLFALVLAIGIVVDDAIVVVEGAARHVERGLAPAAAAIKAMEELLGPIIGITLVLLAVFIPAAFLPGLTGRLYAQFAVVMAATALISAINAATLKPTQCALWLRPTVPEARRNFVFRGFNRLYHPFERFYTRLIGAMTRRAAIMVGVALAIMALSVYGLAKLPTAFIPLEDQGYMLVAVNLPDGAALQRTQAVLDDAAQRIRKVPGVAQVLTIAGISALDNNASLSSAGVAYVILKDWSERGKDEGLLPTYNNLNAALAPVETAQTLVIPPPAIQGIGNSGGFSMVAELRNGSFDYPELQAAAREIVRRASSQSGVTHVASSFRAEAPQFHVDIDRTKAASLHVALNDVLQTMAGYLGSSYVNQIVLFGRVYQVYVQADSAFRTSLGGLLQLTVRNNAGSLIPLGSLLTVEPIVAPGLISLYDLYPAATILGQPAAGLSSGEALSLMDQIAADALPPGTASEWTAMSYQEQLVGGQIYIVFGLAMLLVYLLLAAQYESWIAPIAVVLSVPLALVGPVLVLHGLGVANNLYTQIGLVLLIALAAKNAILIVEVARQHRTEGLAIIESAVAAAQTRFRPILMTSFAFILGMLPLVLATGAGANARRSIGISVASGMLASTCLAVLFVPSFFVLLQRFEEARRAAKRKRAADVTAD